MVIHNFLFEKYTDRFESLWFGFKSLSANFISSLLSKSSEFGITFDIVNELEMMQNKLLYKYLDLIFIFVRNRPSLKMFGTWIKMPFFVGVQIQLLSAISIWNLPLEIRIHHRVIRIHSSHFISVCILLIWIRILSVWIRILTLELRFLSVLSEGFALGVRFIPETLSNLIRNNNTSVLVSSKSNKG